jgi:phage-related protein
VATLILFKDSDGSTPLLKWLDTIPEKALIKCLNRLDRLKALGHMLRRPETDYLRDGIYELRARHLNVNYRILYFFHGQAIAIVSHGLTKESAIPINEIELAVERMHKYISNPKKYSAEG